VYICIVHAHTYILCYVQVYYVCAYYIKCINAVHMRLEDLLMHEFCIKSHAELANSLFSRKFVAPYLTDQYVCHAKAPRLQMVFPSVRLCLGCLQPVYISFTCMRYMSQDIHTYI
jgi:hypothetical protein